MTMRQTVLRMVTQETDTAPTPTSAPQQSDPTAAPTSAPQPTSTPDNNGGSNTAPDDSSADKAEQYIGQPLASLDCSTVERLTEVIMRTSRRPERQDIIIMTSFTVSTTVDDERK